MHTTTFVDSYAYRDRLKRMIHVHIPSQGMLLFPMVVLSNYTYIVQHDPSAMNKLH